MERKFLKSAEFIRGVHPKAICRCNEDCLLKCRHRTPGEHKVCTEEQANKFINELQTNKNIQEVKNYGKDK